MNFRKTAEVFNEIESVSSRNEITRIVGEFYRELTEDDSQIFSYLLLGRVAPLFMPAEFGFSEKSLLNMMDAKATALGVEIDVFKLRSDNGDIGLTAQVFIEKLDQKSKEVSLLEIYENLWAIINTSGKGSVLAKAEVASEMMLKLTPVEAKFYSRIIVGKLRFGASDKTIIDALSYMISEDKSNSEGFKSVYGMVSDLGYLAEIAKKYEKGEIDLGSIKPIPGVPLFSRLVERVKDFDEAMERMGEKFFVQPKFDGLRCQAHKGVDYSSDRMAERIWSKYFGKGQNQEIVGQMDMLDSKEIAQSGVKLYSRNLEELTPMFPDVEAVLSKFKSKDFILDGELIGWDSKKEGFAPFQVTITRKRKFDIDQAVEDVPIRYYVFDILYYNGRDLTGVDLEERMEILDQFFEENKEILEEMIHRTDTPVIIAKEDLTKQFDDAAVQGLEGLIAKLPQGGYQPGIRNYEWIKLKKSMDKNLVDTVDVVIMGYYFGSGKRSAFGIGGLLAGIYNSETGNVESITKIGTGINDEQFGTIKKRLDSIKVDSKPENYLVDKTLNADVWVSPEVICSVEADEVTKSSLHFAGRDGKELGLALRFPRLIEFDRDKRLDDTTSAKEILKIA